MDSCENDRLYLLCGCGFLTCLSFVFTMVIGLAGSDDPLLLLCLVPSFLVAMFGAVLLFSTGRRGVLVAARVLLWISWLLAFAAGVRTVFIAMV